VYSANMAVLVGIRQVLTVPCYQKLTLVVRGQGQVERVEGRIGGHEPVLDVRFDDLRHRRRDFEQRELLGQHKGSFSAWILTVPQFEKNCLACHQRVALAPCRPPALGPSAASERFRSWPSRMVEARYRRLNINLDSRHAQTIPHFSPAPYRGPGDGEVHRRVAAGTDSTLPSFRGSPSPRVLDLLSKFEDLTFVLFNDGRHDTGPRPVSLATCAIS